MDTTITEISELRNHMGRGADSLNIFVVTEATAFAPNGDEEVYFDHATSFQVEGYVLHPRKLLAHPVEIVTEDRDDAEYILELIRTSQVHLAGRGAQGIMYASAARIPDNDFGKLGTRIKES